MFWTCSRRSRSWPMTGPGCLPRSVKRWDAPGVNIETLSAFTHEDRGVIQLVVDDEEDAAEALKAEGIEVEGSRSVMVVTLEDRPGALGRYCRKLADAGVSDIGRVPLQDAGAEKPSSSSPSTTSRRRSNQVIRYFVVVEPRYVLLSGQQIRMG